MASQPLFLLEVSGDMRITRDRQDGPFHADKLGLDMQLAEHLIDVQAVPAGTRRKQLRMTMGANLIYMRADNPITIYYGTSIEGHKTDMFLVHGYFPDGVLISAESDTELRLVVAKEAT